MKVLVAVASKHAATAELAGVIGEELRAGGFEVVVHGLEDQRAPSPIGFDAAIVGSAIYAGRWMKSARRFLDDHATELGNIPTWLFSSGPVGDPLTPDGEPPEVVELAPRVHARDRVVFPGRLDVDRLGLGERIVVRAIGAAEGDFRDLAEVRRWTRQVADDLRSTVPGAPQPRGRVP